MEKIKAKITGTDQEVFVDVDEKIRYEKLDDFVYYLLMEYITKAEHQLADEYEDFKEDLTSEEKDEVVNEGTNYVHGFRAEETADSTYWEKQGMLGNLATAVADNTLYNYVYTRVREIYENRTKYFRFDISMTNSFSVWVKARNQSEAETYLENCYASDLEDYYETDDASISVEGCVDESEDEPIDPVIDVTD